MITLREAVPKAHHLAKAEFGTLRLRLLKLGTRVIETASRIRLAFAAACPEATLFRLIAQTCSRPHLKRWGIPVHPDGSTSSAFQQNQSSRGETDASPPHGRATGPRHGVLGASLDSDGSGYGLIQIPAGGSSRPFAGDLDITETRMTIADGRAVFAKAVEMMARCSAEALASADVRVQAVGRFVPHQANARILDAVADRLNIGNEKVVRSVAEFGNSSAATIVLSLSISHQAKPFALGKSFCSPQPAQG
jgi:hypothetical protein